MQWLGTPGVKGPKWAKIPLLTIGMLGIQCVWSIEMGYGEYTYHSMLLTKDSDSPQLLPTFSSSACPNRSCPSSSWPDLCRVWWYNPSSGWSRIGQDIDWVEDAPL